MHLDVNVYISLHAFTISNHLSYHNLICYLCVTGQINERHIIKYVCALA